MLWFYYLVTNQTNGGQFIIEDVSQVATKIAWGQSEPFEGDKVYAKLTQQFPAKKIVCFVSKEPIACQEACNKHFLLKQDGHTIFEQLPVPSYRNFFRVEPSNSSKPSDATYEIVKYLTNSH